MRGRNKCKILKEIRQKIADENDIPFVTQECSFQGECSGTCPRCEAELRYLEQQLEKRQRLGKTVTVAALSASLMMGLTACPSNVKEGEPPIATEQASVSTDSSDPYEALLQGTIATSEKGAVYYSVDPDWNDVVMGMIPVPTSETEPLVVGEVPNPTEEDPIVLEGDVAYIESTEPTDWGEFAGAPPYYPDE